MKLCYWVTSFLAVRSIKYSYSTVSALTVCFCLLCSFSISITCCKSGHSWPRKYFLAKNHWESTQTCIWIWDLSAKGDTPWNQFPPFKLLSMENESPIARVFQIGWTLWHCVEMWPHYASSIVFALDRAASFRDCRTWQQKLWCCGCIWGAVTAYHDAIRLKKPNKKYKNYPTRT